MTVQYVSPKHTSRVTNNTLLRDNILNSATKTPPLRSRVLPSHRQRGPPGGARRREDRRGKKGNEKCAGVVGGKGIPRRHTV